MKPEDLVNPLKHDEVDHVKRVDHVEAVARPVDPLDPVDHVKLVDHVDLVVLLEPVGPMYPGALVGHCTGSADPPCHAALVLVSGPRTGGSPGDG